MGERSALEDRILSTLQAAKRSAATLEQLKRAIGASQRELERAVSVLEREGDIVRLPRKRIALAERSGLLTGTVKINRGGGALVILDVPDAPLAIDRSNLRPAMDRDRVLVEPTPFSRGGLYRAKIQRILERGRTTIIGVAAPKAPGRLLPMDERIGPYLVLLAPGSPPAPPGQVVSARIVEYPASHRDITVNVEEVLGEVGKLQTEIRATCLTLGINEEFSDAAIAEADAFGEPSGKDLEGRIDLRGKLTMTVDPVDAKDHDDAMSLEVSDQGYELVISIADVSHYVRPGTQLDMEAYERSTSVYFPGESVPMLPERLSGDLASLHPGVDRLAVSAFLDIDRQGNVRDASFARTIIHSVASLTYEAVQSVLDADGFTPSQEARAEKLELAPQEESELSRGISAEVRTSLVEMARLADLLRHRRYLRGAIDMDLPEAVIELDDKGDVGGIHKRPRLFAHRLVEEFMLAANEAVARRIDGAGVPFLYRIHEAPEEDAIDQLVTRLKPLGLRLDHDGAEVEPRMFQQLLEQADKTPASLQLNKMVLRTMKQARYSAHKAIHFGLASQCYTHFTSPIRRYPDIVAHRALLAVEKGSGTFSAARARSAPGGERGRGVDQSGPAATQFDPALPSHESLPPVATHTSQRERRAMEAERDIASAAGALFMERFLGRRVTGMVSGVDKYGYWVELDVAFVEGFVHIGRLREYFDFVSERMELQSRVSDAVIRIGQKVKVRVTVLDLAARRIDLEPA
ncbi:MAG TPA: VacB/RNase II family 3'-5' exoribonuclease [Candidatus Binatia bacterium]|nr:VacB/RNase II family 3'-5' exoribonuclease [Candidatus Binatia bacterium]